MNLRKLTLSLALAVIPALTAPLTAHAQLGVYGTFTGARLSSIPYTSPSTSTTSKENFNAFGGTIGALYDWRDYGPVRLGFDLRGSITSSKKGIQPNSVGAGSHLDTVLGGVRGVFHTPIPILRPYVEAAAGLARTDYGILYGTGSANPNINPSTGIQMKNAFAYEGLAGLDIKAVPFMDVRIIELGIGGVHGGSANAATYTLPGANYPMVTVSTGLVFHLPF